MNLLFFCETYQQEIIEEKMESVVTFLLQHEYSVSYGISSYENEVGLERITKKADEKMLENKNQYYIEHDRRKRR